MNTNRYCKLILLSTLGFSSMYDTNTYAIALANATTTNNYSDTYNKDTIEKEHKYAKYSIKTKAEIKDKAVLLAREGNYQKALGILSDLYNLDNKDIDVAGDYLVVLNWNQEYQKVIDIYEKNQYINMPDYVVFNVASAYYRLEKYDVAKELLKPIIYDSQARELLAKIYLLSDDVESVTQMYAPFINDKDNKIFYKERAKVYSQAGRWSLASKDLEKIYIPNLQNDEQLEIADDLAVCYLRMNKLDKAEILLKAHLSKNYFTTNMIGNYIGLLNRTKRYNEAIRVYNKYFTSYEQVPIFILRELAISYQNSGKINDVEKIYQYLKAQHYNTLEDDLFFINEALKSNKYKNLALTQYNNLLKEQSDNDNAKTKILSQIYIEAKTALKDNKIALADSLYKILIDSDKRYYSVYATDLMNEDKYKKAKRIYEKIQEDEDFSLEALDGLASIYLYTSSYKNAENILSNLQDMTANEYEYSQSAGLYKNRQLGEAYIYSYYYGDHNDGNEFSFGTNVEQYLDNNIFLQANWNKDFIKDNEYDDKIIMNTKDLSFEYKDVDWSMLLGYSWYSWHKNNSGGINGAISWNITDEQKMSIAYNKKPLFNAQSLSLSNDYVQTDNYELNYEYVLNNKEAYYFSSRLSDYSDDNRLFAWQVRQNYLVYDKDANFIRRELFYNKERYKNQSDLYYSPKTSETFGVQWNFGERINDYNGQLQYILGLGWSKDYPEDFYLSPFLGITYDLSISDKTYISASIGYTWNTQSMWGKGSWRYDSRYANISYNIVW